MRLELITLLGVKMDEEIYELKLTPDEKKDLILFLKEGLSSESCVIVTAPELP